jgi:hypothetical protein
MKPAGLTLSFEIVSVIVASLAACGGNAGHGISASPMARAESPATSMTSSGAAGSVGSNTTEVAVNSPVSMWCGVKQTLDSRCTVCHNEHMIAGAPMPMQKYEDLVAPAVTEPSKKVYELVGVRVHDLENPMPPQGMLTGDQLAGIDAWVAAGAPPGDDPTCATAHAASSQAEPGTWPSDCDASYKLLAHSTGGDTEPYTVPAGQEIHPKISIAAPWGSQTMQAIAFRSITDNPKVLHHWILYGPRREFLVGWAPGKQEITSLGAEIGMNLAGGNLTLDLHYNNLLGSSDEGDKSGVEICVVGPEHFRKNTASVFQGFSQFAINVPAHAMNYDVTGQCTVTGKTPVTLLSASPHAHTTAHHMKFTVKKPSGEQIVMHDRAFDFNEQQSYTLETPIQLESGDVVTTTCTYDNPTDRAITFGENTGNEMCFNFATYYPMGALNCGGLGGFGFPSN